MHVSLISGMTGKSYTDRNGGVAPVRWVCYPFLFVAPLHLTIISIPGACFTWPAFLPMLTLLELMISEEQGIIRRYALQRLEV